MTEQVDTDGRAPLSRERVLRRAVALADASGIDAVSMRNLAEELGVVPMAIYKHVANKEELLDGMVEVVVAEVDPLVNGTDWKSAIRNRVLAARRQLLGHPWAPTVIESRTNLTPAVLDHMESIIASFRQGGLSADLTHHAMHALGGRIWGFTQELFPSSPDPGPDPDMQEAMMREMAAKYPNIVEVATSGTHEDESIVGDGCDDQFEFEFALDLMLDGFERLHRHGWTSSAGIRDGT